MKASLVVVIAGLCAAGVKGDIVTDFESMSAGSRMSGTAGWSGWDDVLSSAGVVSADVAFDGAQSLKVQGYTDAVQEYAGVTSGHVVISAQMYIPAGQAGNTYFIVMNRYVAHGNNDGAMWSTQLRFDLTGGRVYDDLRGGSVAISTGRWSEVSGDVNLDADTVTHRFDGQVVSTGTWTRGATSSRAVAAVDLFTQESNTVYYDQVSLSTGGAVVPGPASLASLGLLAACTPRRRSRTR